MEEQKEQIGRNSQKFVRNSYEIRTKFVRISYEFRTNFTSRENSHKFIHVKFVRNSYEIRTNFVRISREFRPIVANTQSKHTSKHTLQSHGQVMLHAPVLAHLGDRHAGTVFTRCHSVVGRPGGAMPDKAKWISDSASTSPPFTTSSWCTLPRKNSIHKPPKHNVAVPINKVEGRLRGANPVGGGVRAARHPMRGVGKGFGAEGGFTRNEGGGA